MGVIKGKRKFDRALEVHLKRIKGNCAKGLVKAAYLLDAESERQVPKDTGNLDKSRKVRFFGVNSSNLSRKASASVAYTAAYARRVHENPRAGKTEGLSPSGKKYKRWAEVGKWKFLEHPFKENIRKIKQLIRTGK